MQRIAASAISPPKITPFVACEVQFLTLDFRALLEKPPNPYVVLDPDLVIVWMNDAYLHATMRHRDELIGQKMFDLFPSAPDSESYRLLKGSFDKVRQSREPDELALIRYDIAKPDGSMDQRYWSATHTPFCDGRNGELAYILQHTVDVTELHKLRKTRDEAGVVRRARAVQERYRSIAAEIEQFRSLVEQAPGFVAIIRGEDHRFLMANEAYRRLVGERELLGKTAAHALPEVVNQGFIDLLDRVLSTGEPYVGRREKIFLKSAEGGGKEKRYLDFIYQPIRGDSGNPLGIFVQGHEVTEQVEAEERHKLLINELNHRVKNTLAVVQGLATQSFGVGGDPSNALNTFGARLSALAGAHNLLTQRNWESANVAEIVRASLQATAGVDADRYRLDGPHVRLQPQTAVSLSMIIHELATNAIKYGSLSTNVGKVEVTWHAASEEGGQRLVLDWQESGGPTVEQPKQNGFGTRLIGRGLGNRRDGGVTLDFQPGGLHSRIEAVL